MFRILSSWRLKVIVSAFALGIFPAKGGDEPKQGFVPAHSFSGAYLAGRTANSSNDMALAIDYFKQALIFATANSQEGTNAISEQIRQDLLLLLLSSGRFDEALLLAEGLKDAPEIERYSRLLLAAQAFKSKKMDKVGSLLELDDPDLMDHLVARLLEAWSLFGQNRQEEAIYLLEDVEGPIWYDLFRHYHLALMYDMQGEKLLAIQAFEQALENQEEGGSTPDSYERILAAFATFKQANGDKQGAIDLLKRGETEIVGRNVLAMMRQMLLQTSSQEALETDILPPMVTDATQGAAETLYVIGTALNRSGSEGHARLYLNIALSMRPAHDATLYQLAEIAIRMGQPLMAIELYGRIAPASPYFRDSQWRLGLTLAEEGQEEEAGALLQELVNTYIDDENLVIALASLHMQMEDFAVVVEIIDKSIKRIEAGSNQSWRLYFQRGIAYERLKKWEHAEDDFRAALKLFPDQPQVLNYLGYSLIDRNMKLDEALGMVAQAAQLRPKDGAIVDSLGWAYYKLGRYGEAIEALEEAVGLRPEDATINDHLGDAYWRVGRKFEAIFQWNHALAGEPEPDEIAKIKQKIKEGLPDEPAATTTHQIIE